MTATYDDNNGDFLVAITTSERYNRCYNNNYRARESLPADGAQAIASARGCEAAKCDFIGLKTGAPFICRQVV